jgi:hypothetical protein
VMGSFESKGVRIGLDPFGGWRDGEQGLVRAGTVSPTRQHMVL